MTGIIRYEDSKTEIQKNEDIVILVDPLELSPELARTVESTFESNGQVVKQRIVAQPRLACGCVNVQPARRCYCGRTFVCARHANETRWRNTCSVCGIFIERCCGVGVQGQPETLFCIEHWRELSWWTRFKLESEYGIS